jgi:diguanylate cyclase (GGDEF)-like protein
VAERRAEQLSLRVAARDRELGQDDLTDLTSRTRFMARMADGQRRDAVALALIDVDSFKSVNDTYGHATGDRLLRRIGTAIGRAAGTDGIAARLGGDEFCVVLPVGTDIAAARATLEALRVEVSETEVVGSWKSLRRTISCGLTIVLPDEKLDDAMSEADMALYSAKEGGRNRIVTVDAGVRDRHREVRAEPTLEQMRQGVEDREFTYYVQPIFALDTGRPVGVEALIRWVTADGRVRLPGEFMHLFTRQYNGTIKPPLDAANEVAATFALPGTNQFCAFNISTSFLKRSFEPSSRWLDELLMGIDPRCAVFEITESAAIDNATAARKMLDFLREKGVRIALDDFGTGHSNLSRLVDLPIDIVKIDRIFVSRLPGNTKRRAIVSALLSLARELGFEVIAEGVETAEQLQALIELGVPMAQGYYLGHPQSLKTWVARQQDPHPGVIALRA